MCDDYSCDTIPLKRLLIPTTLNKQHPKRMVPLLSKKMVHSHPKKMVHSHPKKMVHSKAPKSDRSIDIVVQSEVEEDQPQPHSNRLLKLEYRKEDIRDVLKRYSIYGTGVFQSHVSMGNITGCYSIDKGELDEIWESYTDFIENKHSPSIGLAEKIQTLMPVLADIDIKVEDTNAVFYTDDSGVRRLYTKENIEIVIQAYNAVLSKYIPNITPTQLKCVLLEKEIYTLYSDQKVYYKGGFHLHYPYLFVNALDIKVHIMPSIIRCIKQLAVFKDLGFADSSTVVDEKCFSNPWLMYGGVKEDGMYPYKAVCVYTKDNQRLSIQAGLADYKIFNKDDKQIELTSSNMIRNLPKILSILVLGRDEYVCDIRKDLSKQEQPSRPPRREKSIASEKNMDNNIETCIKLMPMISSKRADDRLDWLQIGWTLFNIGDGSDEALDLWIEFSSKCPEKFDRDTCVYEWGKMNVGNITIRTLKYYASIDSPAAYIEFRKNESESFLIKSIKGTHNDIAKLMYKLHGTNFICASVASKLWYQFIGHHWKEVEEGCTLRSYISNEIVTMYISVQCGYKTELAQTNDDAEQKSLKDKIKGISRVIDNLKSAPFKNNIMRECMEVFYDPDFKHLLNTNQYTICFNNGVMDLSINIFRPGAPEDYISNALPIDYREFQYTSPEVEDVNKFLEKVFPDKTLRTYYKDTCSDAFVGGNHRKTVVFWTGGGDNGKSVAQTFMEKLFGPLAIKFSTTLVTGKKSNIGAASPELARAGGGVRWATLEEPDSDEQLNMGVLKLLSGNDSYFARDLFEKGKATREILPMFKLTFICNKLPDFRQIDQATKNRLRVIPFESTFIREDNPEGYPESYDEQLRQKRFPMDLEFNKKIPAMLEAFAWVLLEHRKRIGIREEPNKVRCATEQYYKQNDIYKQFIEEHIFCDEEAQISLTELYGSFKDWFKDGFGNRQVPIKNELKDYFEKLWGTFSVNRGCIWSGFRLRCIGDEESNCLIVEGGQEII
jgi:P4 family phage/plasmid primase-like protien